MVSGVPRPKNVCTVRHCVTTSEAVVERTRRQKSASASTALGPKVRGSSVLGLKVRGSTVLGPKVRKSTDLGPKVRGSTVLGPKVKRSTVLGPKVRGSTVLGPKGWLMCKDTLRCLRHKFCDVSEHVVVLASQVKRCVKTRCGVCVTGWVMCEDTLQCLRHRLGDV